MPRAGGRIDDQDYMFAYQEPAALDQPDPVQNTWYDVLPPTDNVRIYDVAVNIEDTDEELEVQVLLDGEIIAAIAEACTNSTSYYARLILNAIARIDQVNLNSAASWHNRAFLIEGVSNVQVRVRKVTAAGVGNLTGVVAYGVLSPAI